jgi:RNA ligase (TIGR02306 family)
MSNLIVEVCKIEEIRNHSNADRVELARVKNWWSVVPKGKYSVGSKVLYIPPDAILPEELAVRWGIAKFLAPLAKYPDGTRPPGLRVRAAKFRGERSYGTIQDVEDPTWDIGKDLVEHYGITKYEPPVKSHAGDAAPEVEGFHKYTDIESFGNFPGVFQEGEEVVIDEKIHGTNCRVGLLAHDEGTGVRPTLMAGSHTVRRKEFDNKGNKSLYWFPLELKPGQQDSVVELLDHLHETHKQPIILFGEIYGPGIQDMHYGRTEKGFRVFDMTIGGRWIDYDDKVALWTKFGVEYVPLLYRGPFSVQKCEELVDGPTTVCDPSTIREPFKGREGFVIRPVKERFDPTLSGRAILKYVSADYHDRKNKNPTENH